MGSVGKEAFPKAKKMGEVIDKQINLGEVIDTPEDRRGKQTRPCLPKEAPNLSE